MPGQPGGHAECADSGSGAQHTKADRAGVENVVRIDRQHRRRAAEQYGEEVERDRAQQDFAAPDEGEA